MTNGGSGRGQGRKKGSLATKTRKVAEAAAKKGLTPLEIMLEAMQDSWAKAKEAQDDEERLKLRGLAISIAKDAAPYMHAKIAPRNPDDGAKEIHVHLVGALTDGHPDQPAGTALGATVPLAAKRTV